MKLIKIVSLFLLIFLFSGYFSTAFADNLVIENNGTVEFVSDTGVVKQFLFSHERFINNQVLGASSGVVITVSLSSFLPTDTPIPTTVIYQPTPTPTPNTNPAQQTATSQPTSSPTSILPASSNSLLATITTPSTTTTQTVNKVIQQTNSAPLVITPSSNSREIVITQGKTQATTSLPLQISTATKTLSVTIQGNQYAVVSPTKAIDTIRAIGSYIIPSSIKITLIAINNKPLYQVKGTQHIQLLGLFIIDLPITINISAGTGQLIQVKNPLAVSLIEFFHVGKRVIH